MVVRLSFHPSFHPSTRRERNLGWSVVFVESSKFQNFITAVIAINAIILGLETSQTVMNAAGSILYLLDQIAVAIFVIELLMKLAVYRLGFFRRSWNIFDFTIVAITLLPMGQGVSVLRALRILRAFRLISTVPSTLLSLGLLARYSRKWGMRNSWILAILTIYRTGSARPFHWWPSLLS